LEKDERQVVEWYNKLSSSYDELYGKEQSYKYETVLGFLGKRHFQTLVDVGCGTGSFLKETYDLYDHAVGIDISIEMLKIAKSKHNPNADYVLASSKCLPLKNDSSDCTVSISTAKDEPNLPVFLADAQRLGRVDSLLAVTLFQEPGQPNPTALSRSVRSTRMSERETLYLLRKTHTLE
jgi:ubiquinone/menaquinone biosynthesis C-methylase UbiE